MRAEFDDLSTEIFFREVEKRLIPKIQNSRVTLVLISGRSSPDPRQAVEVGASLLLDKPMILVVRPGVEAPSRLARVADHIIEFDITKDESRRRLSQEIASILRQYKESTE